MEILMKYPLNKLIIIFIKNKIKVFKSVFAIIIIIIHRIVFLKQLFQLQIMKMYKALLIKF